MSTIGNYYNVINNTTEALTLSVIEHDNSDEWYLNGDEGLGDIALPAGSSIALHVEGSGNQAWKFAFSLNGSGGVYTTVEIVGHQGGNAADNGGFSSGVDIVAQITDNAIGASNQGSDIVSVTDYSYGPGDYKGQAYTGNILIGPVSAIQLGGWMGQYADKIGGMRLRDLMIPGTHDSGMFVGAVTDTITSDGEGIYKMAPGTAESWAITQNRSIAQQLQSGIRYLDLRVTQQVHGDATMYPPMICHGVAGPAFSTVLQQVADFLGQAGSEQEIVILDLNHLYNIDADTVAQQLHQYLATYLVDSSAVTLQECSVDDIRSAVGNYTPDGGSALPSSPQVIVLWNSNPDAAGAPLPGSSDLNYFLFDNPYPSDPATRNGIVEQDTPIYTSPYAASVKSAGELNEAMANCLAGRDQSRMFVLQTQPTESGGTVVGRDLDPSQKAPRNLYQFNSLFVTSTRDWLNANRAEVAANGNIMIQNFSDYWQAFFCIQINIE